MTQEQVAAHLGVTKGAVSGWETGQWGLRRNNAKKLDELFRQDGRLLEAFFPTTNPLDVLRADHEALVREVADLRQTVEKLLASQVAAAKRRSGRG